MSRAKAPSSQQTCLFVPAFGPAFSPAYNMPSSREDMTGAVMPVVPASDCHALINDSILQTGTAAAGN